MLLLLYNPCCTTPLYSRSRTPAAVHFLLYSHCCTICDRVPVHGDSDPAAHTGAGVQLCQNNVPGFPLDRKNLAASASNNLPVPKCGILRSLCLLSNISSPLSQHLLVHPLVDLYPCCHATTDYFQPWFSTLSTLCFTVVMFWIVPQLCL